MSGPKLEWPQWGYRSGDRWDELEIDCKARLDVCPLCAAVIGDWEGREKHKAWHLELGK